MIDIRFTGTLLFVMALACALPLAAPAQTITTTYVNDLLLFLDGAHRIAWGQVPNRDFHTALGPLVYYIPALGLWLSGRLGGAMPVGMGMFILAMGPLAARILGSRLQPVLALPLGAFLLLLLAAPVNLGDPLASISFAMFYNRIGWVALALLVVMYLRPIRLQPYDTWLDATCAAILMLVEIYCKVTYAPVALIVVGFIVLDPRQRLWALMAVSLTAAGVLGVELVWRSTLRYGLDLLETAKVSGGRDPQMLIQYGLLNLRDILVAVILMVLALSARWSLRDICFYVFCLLSGLVILTQNAHSWGIIGLFAAAAVAAEIAVRPPESGRGTAAKLPVLHALRSGAPLLLGLMLLPGIASFATTLGLHTSLAWSSFGTPLGLPKLAEVRFGRLWSPGDYGFTEKYIRTFAAGARELAAVAPGTGRVLTLDFANPFSSGLDLDPPEGDLSWMHWGRNIDAATHLTADQLLANADVVMVPKVGINSRQLWDLYGPFIEQRFSRASNTELWTIYLRPHPSEATP